MGRNKIEKFAENKTFPNFFQPDYGSIKVKDFFLKGNWRSGFFKNNHPVVLELGCGKGEYTVALARKYPTMNFIGIDRKGARMWHGCKTSVEQNMKNVAFLRIPVNHIIHYFGKNEINEIWITFPDPHPKHSKSNKRLTSPFFLNSYKELLIPNGFIHLKTDSELLFDYTLSVINDQNHTLIDKQTDIYSLEQIDNGLDIETYYEKMWKEQGFKIRYIKFQLNQMQSVNLV
ncbi:MAG: tRNA (guanosine(46)-N7)-methyltransferase TrmB [Bacteroidales bacterium]|nr:tRNA (guanosine(46)-N7)-methyltransferase TrmB [Bacteroidales bacterium]